MNGNKWREMSTAERLRAFACYLNPVLAELFYTAADELENYYELEEQEYGNGKDKWWKKSEQTDVQNGEGID
jgi:hypothetical protein